MKVCYNVLEYVSKRFLLIMLHICNVTLITIIIHMHLSLLITILDIYYITMCNVTLMCIASVSYIMDVHSLL